MPCFIDIKTMKIPKYKELRVIKTIKPYENILEGTVGTILLVYENEPAYEIEFIDKSGNFIEGTFALIESYITDQIGHRVTYKKSDVLVL